MKEQFTLRPDVAGISSIDDTGQPLLPVESGLESNLHNDSDVESNYMPDSKDDTYQLDDIGMDSALNSNYIPEVEWKNKVHFNSLMNAEMQKTESPGRDTDQGQSTLSNREAKQQLKPDEAGQLNLEEAGHPLLPDDTGQESNLHDDSDLDSDYIPDSEDDVYQLDYTGMDHDMESDFIPADECENEVQLKSFVNAVMQETKSPEVHERRDTEEEQSTLKANQRKVPEGEKLLKPDEAGQLNLEEAGQVSKPGDVGHPLLPDDAGQECNLHDDSDLDSDYIPDSEDDAYQLDDTGMDHDRESDFIPADECENEVQLKSFVNAVMQETKSPEIHERRVTEEGQSALKANQRKVHEGEIIRDSKYRGIYIKKYIKSNEGRHGEKKDSRPYDTVHACKYCFRLFSHIQDHLEKKHYQESDVKTIIQLRNKMKKVENKGTLQKEIKTIQDCLRFEGDNVHNLKVKEFKEGELLIQRKSCCKDDFNVLEYGPCPQCFQWIKLDSSTFTHQKNCPKLIKGKTDSVTLGKNNFISQAKMITGEVNSSGSKMLKEEVFVKMRKNELSDCAQGDFLIRALGEVWLTKSIDHKLRRGKIASYQMRLAARLLICCRKHLKNPRLTMFDLLVVDNFDLVAEATLQLCGKNEDNELKNPSVATKLGFDIGRLLGLKCGYCLRKGDMYGKKEAKQFLELLAYEWPTKVTKHVYSLVRQRHFNNRIQLPHPKDIETLATRLSTAVQSYDLTDKTHYNVVAKTVLLRLMVYNRRRSGEIEELPMKAFFERSTGVDDVEESLLGDLTSTERYLVKSQQLMWIRGKHRRRVPVLVPPDTTEALEYLVDPEVRRLGGLKIRNRNMFATTGNGVIDAAQCMKELGLENSQHLVHPDRLTSTGYRAYMATIAQCIGLKDHQLQRLCTHLGQTENIHKTHCRFTMEGIERIQLCKLMLLHDRNLISHFKGVSLEDIEFKDIVDNLDGQVNQNEANEVDITDKDMAESFTVKCTRWKEKELKELHLYAEKWIERQITPNRKECNKMIKLSKDNKGELWKRTPELILKKLSAMNMKARKTFQPKR